MVPTKICHHCQHKIKGKNYTQRFTDWGLHLKKVHYKEWGTNN